MKRCLLLLVMLVSASDIFAAKQDNQRRVLRGSVAIEDGSALGFATIEAIAVADSLKKFAVLGEEDGRFSLSLPRGEYNVVVSFFGYLDSTKQIKVEGDRDMGEIVLKPDALVVDDVEVTGQMFEKRADGYAMALSRNPIAKGKDLYDALSIAPGVSTYDGLTINGRSGAKVYVNNRPLNLSGDDLENYLKNLRAEDVISIEVIHEAGVQYDADASGGIIKITLRKLHESGYYGSATIGSSVDFNGVVDGKVNGNISYRKDKFSLYSNIGYSRYNYNQELLETTSYDSGSTIVNNAPVEMDHNNTSAELSGVYDISDNQSVGLNLRYGKYSSNTGYVAHSIYESDDYVETLLDNDLYNGSDRINLSANYFWTIDTLGSNMKLYFDYTNSVKDSHSNYTTSYITPDLSSYLDRDFSEGRGEMYSANVDFELPLNKTMKLKTGAKYYHMSNYDDITYQDLVDGVWVDDDTYSDLFNYDEDVVAAYIDYSASFGKFMLMAGVRAEQTFIDIRSQASSEDNNKDSYLSLFPSLNLMYNINAEKGHSLTANINRKVSRPSFSSLSPFRLPMNSYTYIVGNPFLEPSFPMNYTLTATLWGKYSVSAMAYITDGVVGQRVITDPDDPEILLYKHMNGNKQEMYGISLYAPFKVTDWWSGVVNSNICTLIASYYDTDDTLIEQQTPYIYASLMNTFNLGKGWNVTLNGRYSSSAIAQNMTVTGSYAVYGGVTKDLIKDKLSLAVDFDNILFANMVIDIAGDGFSKHIVDSYNRRKIGFTLRYSFAKGKKLNVKKAESGASSESGRF